MRNASVCATVTLDRFPSIPSPHSMELGSGNGGGCGGERAAKRARLSSGEEDRLSALPDDVLVLILLKLSSTRAAAQTSVLSRSWRRVWALLPALSFDETAEPGRLRDALDGHEVALRSLVVGADGAAAESLGVWLPSAARRVSGNLSLYSYVRVSKEEEEEDDDDDEAPRRGVFELPCFDKATSVTLFLSFHGLALPRAGVFARLADIRLHRVWFHGPGDLGDAVSSPRCPCLRRLTVDDARGLVGLHLAIRSETLLEVELRNLHALSRLTVVAPALRELAVVLCFVKNRPVADVSAPLLTNLDWSDEYDPSSVRLGKMPRLRWLGTDSYLVYGNYAFIHNHFLLTLLQRFEGIQTLSLTLMYLRDIENYEYMMEDMTVLPDITFLSLMVVANGHAFEASAFHVLRLCTGIRRLTLQFGLEARTVCSSDCTCDQPADWETEELSFNHLEEVEITGWRGSEHEVAFVKRLFNWGTKLKGLFGTQEFYRNHAGISQESVQFHRKNAGTGKISRVPNRP